MYKITNPIYWLSFLFILISLHGNAQFKKETIYFESANPFSLNDIIEDLEDQEKQKVYGELTIPVDSLEPHKKYPLIIGVAGSNGWKKHHLDLNDFIIFRSAFAKLYILVISLTYSLP